MNSIRCKSCGANLTQDQLEPGSEWTTCTYCMTLLRLEPSQIRPLAGAQPAHSGGGGFAPIKLSAPIPDRFEVEDAGGALTIKRKWFSLAAFFLLFFSLFWNGFMVAWFAISISEGVWFMALFGLLHGSVGIGLAYYTLCLFLNTTTVRVGQGRLSVAHAPLPWRGAMDVATDGIQQLYCREKITRGKNGETRTYEVHLVLPSGKSSKLVTGLPEPEHALFIEQSIERFLGITDRPVDGEFKG